MCRSRILSQEQTIRDMKEERWNNVVLVDMLRTKINALEKDKAITKFQLADMSRRLSEMGTKLIAVLEDEAKKTSYSKYTI